MRGNNFAITSSLFPLLYLRGIKALCMKYENLIQDQPAELISKLISELAKQKAVEIHFDFEDDDQWSLVRIHTEDDNEISLRFDTTEQYQLVYGYYDDEDEFTEIKKTLGEKEASLIPKTLHKAMGKVLEEEEGLRLPASILSR